MYICVCTCWRMKEKRKIGFLPLFCVLDVEDREIDGYGSGCSTHSPLL